MRKRHYGRKAKVGMAILLFSVCLIPFSQSISMADEGNATRLDTARTGGAGAGTGAAAAGAAGAGANEGLSTMAVVGMATKFAVSIVMILYL